MKKCYLIICCLISAHVFAQSGSQEFIANGSFTVPGGVTEIFIEAVGAGGSGGYNGTGGGGGGGYASGNYTVEPGQTINIIIGIPGSGALAGTTTAEGFLAATGGENGISVPNPEIGGGGAGGVGAGGNVANYTGGAGGGGYYTYFGGGGGGAAGADGNGLNGGNTIAWTGICHTPGGDGGLSGGAPGGNGGKGAGFTDDFCNVTDPAAPGAVYGGGGGGGNGNGGAPANGAGGYCLITWCAINTIVISNMEYGLSAEQEDATYQWINCADGSFIPGATEQSYTVTETGSYAVIIDDGFCIDTSACQFVEVIIQNVDDLLSRTVSLHPNPATSFIELSVPADGNYFFELHSSNGQLLSTFTDTQLFVGNLPEGVYYVAVYDGSATCRKLFIKQ